MDELKQQQLEALEVASEYCTKLITGIESIVIELEGEKLPDTDEFLKHIVGGINWIIEVFNGTRNLINENSMVIDKDVVNQSIITLNRSMEEKNNQKTAEALLEILTFIKTFQAQASKAGL